MLSNSFLFTKSENPLAAFFGSLTSRITGTDTSSHLPVLHVNLTITHACYMCVEDVIVSRTNRKLTFSSLSEQPLPTRQPVIAGNIVSR